MILQAVQRLPLQLARTILIPSSSTLPILSTLPHLRRAHGRNPSLCSPGRCNAAPLLVPGTSSFILVVIAVQALKLALLVLPRLSSVSCQKRRPASYSCSKTMLVRGTPLATVLNTYGPSLIYCLSSINHVSVSAST